MHLLRVDKACPSVVFFFIFVLVFLYPRQVTAFHLKIGYRGISSMSVTYSQSWNEYSDLPKSDDSSNGF